MLLVPLVVVSRSGRQLSPEDQGDGPWRSNCGSRPLFLRRVEINIQRSTALIHCGIRRCIVGKRR